MISLTFLRQLGHDAAIFEAFELIYGWMNGRMLDGLMDGCMDGCLDGRMDDRWMNVWMDSVLLGQLDGF